MKPVFTEAQLNAKAKADGERAQFIEEALKEQRAFFHSIRKTPLTDVVKVVEGVCYIAPDDDREYIIAAVPMLKIAVETDFYEADDFYYRSDYNYVVVDGILTDRE